MSHPNKPTDMTEQAQGLSLIHILIDAAQLLNNITNKEFSSDMKLPNVYVGIEKRCV